MQILPLLVETRSSASWFIIILAVAVAAALLLVAVAWLNRRWRK